VLVESREERRVTRAAGMPRLSQSSFLTALDKHFSKVRTGGSLFITFKRYVPKPSKKGKENPEGSAPLCLIRAKLGNTAVSTVVPQKDAPKMQAALGTIMRGNMDALKATEKVAKKDKKR